MTSLPSTTSIEEEQLELPFTPNSGLPMVEPEAPSWVVERAKWEDRELFLRLWLKFMEEEHSLGSYVLPTRGNLLEYLGLFESYCRGSLFGLGVLARSPSPAGAAKTTEGAEEVVGVGMVGEPPNTAGSLSFETELGRSARIWGIYTEPPYREMGVSTAMMAFGRRELLEMGFEVAESEVLTLNTPGELNAQGGGADFHSSRVIVKLNDLDKVKGSEGE